MFYQQTKELSITQSRYFPALQVLLGTLYLALLSQAEIPLRPVPITLHTFAIFTMGLYMGKNKAALSCIAYLAAATVGLPVFPNLYSDPLWMIGPSAGYCLSFPFAAYAIGYLAESDSSSPSFLRAAFSVIVGQLVIYLVGVSWLACFIGLQQALVVGLYPFLPLAGVKIAAAVSVKMTTNRLTNLF